MGQIFILFIKAAVSFALSIILLIIAAAKKRSLFYVGAAIAFILSVGFVGYATYLVFIKAKNTVAEKFEHRTGMEIYVSLLGKPMDCVQVLAQQDQIVPRLDPAIWLYFSTCKAEMVRISQQQTYAVDTVAPNNWKETKYGSLHHPTWWQPATLGDTIIVYEYSKNEYTDGQAIYCNSSFSEAYLIDVLD